MNSELYKDIEIHKLTVDDVSWNVEGISEAEDALPFMNTNFGFDAEAPDVIRATTNFTFANDQKTYFRCKVDVWASVPETTFKDVLSDPSGRKYVAYVCGEMAMGHIRNMLIYATSMAGLGLPILLSGIVPSTLKSEAFPEMLPDDIEETSEE